MVRARPQTRDKLRALSHREGISAVEMLDRLIAEHEDAKLLSAFATMAPTQSAAGHAAIAAWESGPWEGLADEDFSWVGADPGPA